MHYVLIYEVRDEDPVDGAMLIFRGPSAQAAGAFAKTDPYVTNGRSASRGPGNRGKRLSGGNRPRTGVNIGARVAGSNRACRLLPFLSILRFRRLGRGLLGQGVIDHALHFEQRRRLARPDLKLAGALLDKHL